VAEVKCKHEPMKYPDSLADICIATNGTAFDVRILLCKKCKMLYWEPKKKLEEKKGK